MRLVEAETSYDPGIRDPHFKWLSRSSDEDGIKRGLVNKLLSVFSVYALVVYFVFLLVVICCLFVGSCEHPSEESNSGESCQQPGLVCLLFCGLPASSPWTWSVSDVRDRGRCNNRGNTLEHWSQKKRQKTFTQFRYSWIQHPARPRQQLGLANTYTMCQYARCGEKTTRMLLFMLQTCGKN